MSRDIFGTKAKADVLNSQRQKLLFRKHPNSKLRICYCQWCKGQKAWPLIYFRENLAGHVHMTRRAQCRGSDILKRDAAKKKDPIRIKVQTALRREARNKASRFSMTISEYFNFCNYNKIDEITEATRTAFAGKCAGTCGRSYSEMTHGLTDLTFDHEDPNHPGVWPGNFRHLCADENRQKQGKTKIERVIIDRCNREFFFRLQNFKEIKLKPPEQLKLWT